MGGKVLKIDGEEFYYRGRAEGKAEERSLISKVASYIKEYPQKTVPEICAALGCKEEDVRWTKQLIS